jgi:CheY-like chemotaxis protein
MHKGQLEQVLVNLATNARDAMKQGGTFRIETSRIETFRADEEVTSQAVLVVSDTGCGMDERTQEKIFEPFFTTKEAGKGTGLGLAIVHGIIRQHAGQIKVRSEVGRGTTFEIRLPITTRLPRSKQHSSRSEDIEGGKETILIAEDDAQIRDVLQHNLSRLGYRLILAANGQEAIDRFKTEKDQIQLVLLDVIMPEKSGELAYQEIKTLRPDIRSILMSGYTADVIQSHGDILRDVPLLT